MSRNVKLIIKYLKDTKNLPYFISVPEEIKLYRTRAGSIQRAKGAWSWYLKREDRTTSHCYTVVGSQSSLKDTVKAIKENRIVIFREWNEFELFVN